MKQFIAAGMAWGILLTNCISRTAAEDWMSWRGPTADGRAGTNAKPPLRWDQQTNIAWKAQLPGEGSATPIVVGNQLFVLSAAKTERKSPTAIVNDERAKTTPDEFFYQFIVTSIDRTTGKTIWQRMATEQVPHEGKHETNTYAAGSPVSDGERLYFCFGSRGVFCYSLDGASLWQINLGRMRTRNGWGEAVTPALTDDALIVNWDQEENSFIVAIDKLTGQVRWKTERSGEVTSWNTPFVTRFNGKQQIIVNGTGSVKSYDAQDGTLLWECGGQTVNAIPSPVRFRDSAICMSGYRGSLACSIPLNSRGNVTDSASLGWKVTQGTPYVPSPIISDTRLLFTAGNTDVLSCLDAVSGKPLLERKRLTEVKTLYASPMWANGYFYFTGREGTTVVLKDNATLDIEAVNKLDDRMDASPVAVDDQLFLRSWNTLYCIAASPKAAAKVGGEKSPDKPSSRLAFQQVELEQSAETSANASLGDLDSDGDLDIILAKGRHWPLYNRILLNDGRGRFTSGHNLGEQPDRTYSATVGDLDRDGDLDVVVSNDNPDEKKVFFNDGKAGFVLAGTWGDPAWSTRNTSLADLNGDQYPDLVVANRQSTSYIILNDGHGNFPRDRCTSIATTSATTIVAADFNGDRLMDLAVPHRDEGVSRVLFNDSSNSFQRGSSFGPSKSSTRACATGDLNRDGAADLIVGNDRSGLMVSLNDGAGSFPATVSLGNSSLVPYALAAADMNQDQALDIVVGYAKGGSRIFLNSGKGEAYQEVTFGDGRGAVYGIAIGDLNADGKQDIVQARSDAPNAIFFNLGSVTGP